MRLPLSPALALLVVLPLHPAVLGTSTPAASLSAARVLATLPPAEQAPWLSYLKRSDQQLSFDRDELFQERSHLPPNGSGPIPPLPHESNSARSIPLDRDPAYFASAEALRIASTIVSFQLPNGGWSKNLDMSGPARLPGQSFTPNNISHFLGASSGPDADFDAPRDPTWNYAGTLDNDATNTELHFLVRVAAAHPAGSTTGHQADPLRASFIRGVFYLLAAQFPNGGWPQVWPLEGGYHDAITFNDNAVTESASLLRDVSLGAGDYAFVPADLRARAATAADRAVTCVLRTQVLIHGEPTLWAQQHDALTLAPVAGRNFEPAALSAGESADILLFLMRLPHPSPAVRASVEAGTAWLRANAIHGYLFTGGRDTRPSPSNPAGGRHLEAQPGAPALWPRYTSLTTGKPIFGDRDKTIHDNVMDLTAERRNGYAWYSSGPQKALDAYARWSASLSPQSM